MTLSHHAQDTNAPNQQYHSCRCSDFILSCDLHYLSNHILPCTCHQNISSQSRCDTLQDLPYDSVHYHPSGNWEELYPNNQTTPKVIWIIKKTPIKFATKYT